jgi:hypothetical protein
MQGRMTRRVSTSGVYRSMSGQSAAPVIRDDAWRYGQGVTADEALIEAWNLGMDRAGWNDAVMERAEQLLPILVEAGYVLADGDTWGFTPEGVARAEELERPLGD